MPVKLTVQVKLAANESQRATLLATMRLANTACNLMSERAWATNEFRQFSLHRLVYYPIRAAFPALGAGIVSRCETKVADAYKLDRKKQRRFKPLGAIAYDKNILSWKFNTSTVSIRTVDGRQTIQFVCGERQRALLSNPRGEADLVFRDGRFYLFVTVDINDRSEKAVMDHLGVDLGVVNIASTSDGQHVAGGHLNKFRQRSHRLRKRLQSKGTRSARRLLAKRRCKESRFSRDVNHCISKHLVELAEHTSRGIALEDLKGIRERIRATRDVRRSLHSWAFADLAAKITYKAALVGVPVLFVDPRNTSRCCPICGHIAKANRKSRDRFHCQQCGYEAHADTNGAENIRRKANALYAAAVNQPNAPSHDGVRIARQMVSPRRARSCKPSPSGDGS